MIQIKMSQTRLSVIYTALIKYDFLVCPHLIDAIDAYIHHVSRVSMRVFEHVHRKKFILD